MSPVKVVSRDVQSGQPDSDKTGSPPDDNRPAMEVDSEPDDDIDAIETQRLSKRRSAVWRAVQSEEVRGEAGFHTQYPSLNPIMT